MAANLTPSEIIHPQKPLEIRLYDANDEPTVFVRSIVPWGILKKALRMSKLFDDPGKNTEEDLDSLASLIIEAFGDRFSIEELDKGADIGEMLTVIQNIIARAGLRMKEWQLANPTLPPGAEK